jgi:type VII secretion protein EccB
MPMQSRTDQVHSYQFFLQRVVSGLVARESDPAELPFRRLGWSAFGSIMVMVLVAAGFGVYGLYAGGGATSWRNGDSVIMVKGTDTAYIYRGQRLYPMANLVSARLAVGNAAVTQVTARSLEGVPRGPTLGIPNAPEGLPGNGDLLTGGWTMCSEQWLDERNVEQTSSVLGIGRGPVGGESAGERAVLVRDVSDGSLQLVWHGHRFPLDVPEPALLAVGWDAERALPVSPAWLYGLPAGEPVVVPTVPAPGEPTAAFGGLSPDGEVFTGEVIQDNDTFYLVQSDALQRITPFQARLTREPLRTDVPSATVTSARIDGLPQPTPTSPPETAPELLRLNPADNADAPLCATFPPGQFMPEIWAGARLPWRAEGLQTPRRTDEGTVLADYVIVEGGRAALVRTLPSPDAPADVWHIISDQGVQYLLPAPDVAVMLGYDPRGAVPVPAGLVARLPAGPVLDPAAAVLTMPLTPPA